MKRGKFVAGFSALVILFWITGATNIVSARSDIGSSQFKHPVHVSFTTIEYFEDEGGFRILFKIFVDDFDLILKTKYGKDLKLSEGRWEKYYLKTINNYIFEHFKFIIDGKDKTVKQLNYSKHEVKEQALWIYYNYKYNGNDAKFDIHNSLMTDLYPDQNNLLIFTFKKEQLAFKFNVNKTKEEISFQ